MEGYNSLMVDGKNLYLGLIPHNGMNTIKLYLIETTDARKVSNEKRLLVVSDCTGACVCLTPGFSQFAAFMSIYANESFWHNFIPLNTATTLSESPLQKYGPIIPNEALEREMMKFMMVIRSPLLKMFCTPPARWKWTSSHISDASTTPVFSRTRSKNWSHLQNVSPSCTIWISNWRLMRVTV